MGIDSHGNVVNLSKLQKQAALIQTEIKSTVRGNYEDLETIPELPSVDKERDFLGMYADASRRKM